MVEVRALPIIGRVIVARDAALEVGGRNASPVAIRAETCS
jgi:hypothetical protein